MFGFLGPNGAGKTTMLLGLITPTSGDARILGAPIGDHRVRERVGFLSEQFRFHDWPTASEFLTLHADLYHLPRSTTRQRVPELLDLVGLTSFASQKLCEFSKGMLQRIGLAQALVNDPDLVILDEPTSGLDPVGRCLVRDIIRDARQRGTTVFLNPHLLSEVEITCDRVAFIKHGKVLQVSPLQTLVEGELSVEVRARNLSTALETSEMCNFLLMAGLYAVNFLTAVMAVLTSVPSPLMIGYAALYIAATLTIAIRQFNRRDL